MAFANPVLYLCYAFPVVSETFISDQVEALIRAGVPVKVLALTEGNNAQRTAQWHAEPAHAGVLEVMCPQGINKIAALLSLPRTLLRIMVRPQSWRLSLFCLRHCTGIFAQASLIARWLDKHPQQGSALVCHFGNIGYMGALLKAWGSLDPVLPQVTVFHGFDMSQILLRKGQGFYARLFASPRHASVPITDFWRERLVAMGDPAATTIRLGVDTDRLAFRPRTYPKDRPVRMITVGRLTGKKGQMDVIRALSTLPEGPVWARNWEYHLVGAGPQEAQLKELAKNVGLEGKVLFHGALPHNRTLELLHEADVFVLTSRVSEDGDMEGLPVALMEAMASGMPTISTFHSGIPELITHGESGLLGAEGDEASLRDNLCTLLGQPELWPNLTVAGRHKVEREYRIADNFQKFWTFVQNHINQTSPH